jgi:hypothetical protein
VSGWQWVVVGFLGWLVATWAVVKALWSSPRGKAIDALHPPRQRPEVLILSDYRQSKP